MTARALELKDLLCVFSQAGPDDQGWSDFGEEKAQRMLANFSNADWDALWDGGRELGAGELEVLAPLLAAQTHHHVVPLLIQAVLKASGQGWIEAAEVLGLKHMNDPNLLKPYERQLQDPLAVDFMENRVRDWVNYPVDGAQTFDDYLAAYSHLVGPSVIALLSFARRSPNKSLERTRAR